MLMHWSLTCVTTPISVVVRVGVHNDACLVYHRYVPYESLCRNGSFYSLWIYYSSRDCLHFKSVLYWTALYV